MAEPITWITRGGKHIPIFTDAPTEDEKKKEWQMRESKKQASEKILEEKYKNINPNYKQNASNLDKEGYNNNCVKCALAFEANMRGNDVQANPYEFGKLNERDMSKFPEKAFNQKDVWDVGSNNRERVISEINANMEDYGNNSRAIVQVVSEQTKHTINVINQGGKILIIDAQAGKQGSVAEMLKGLPTKSVKMFRTDDKDIVQEYSNWAYKRR